MPEATKKQEGEGDKVKGHVREYLKWKNNLEDYYKRFSANYRTYTGYKKDVRGTKSKANDPMAFEFIERQVPHVLDRAPKVITELKTGTYIEKIMELELPPLLMQDLIKEAEEIFDKSKETVTAMLEYTYHSPERAEHSQSMKTILLPVVREFFITGNTCGEVFWNIKREIVEEDGKPVKRIVFDSPDFKAIPIERIAFNPAKTLKTSDVYYVQKFVTYDDLKAEEAREEEGVISGVYHNLGKLKEKMSAEKDRTVDAEENLIHRSQDVSSQKLRGPIEILERWEGARITVIAERSVVIRDEYDPLKLGTHPLVFGMEYELTNEPFAMGEIDPIYLMARAKNLIINQRIDLIAKALKPPLRIDPTAPGIKLESLSNAYVLGGPVYGPEGSFEYMQGPSIPQDAFLQPDEFQGRAEAALGLSGYVGGTPQAYTDKTKGTMGGTMALIEQAQPRLALKADLIEQEIIRPILVKWLRMLANLMGENEKKWILVGETNPEWMAVTRDILKGETELPMGEEDEDREQFDLAWMVDIETGSMAAADKQTEIANFKDVMQTGNEMGLMLDRDKLWVDLAKKMGFKEPEQYQMTEEQIMAKQEEQPMAEEGTAEGEQR